MDKARLFKSIEDKEERMFLSFIYDKIEASYKRSCPGFADFCSQTEMEKIKNYISQFDGFEFVSKIKNSERLIPAINSEYAEIPTDIIAVSELNSDSATHRDILGSLMSLGIKRCKIGDIVITDRAYFEIKNEITPYILSNLSKIKNKNVKPYIYDGEIEKTFNFSELFLTVSSLRADCIVGGIAKLSRETAKEYILSGNLSVNSKVQDNPSKPISEGDILSLKGYGKYVFPERLGTTKKDRLKILIKKYI